MTAGLLESDFVAAGAPAPVRRSRRRLITSIILLAGFLMTLGGISFGAKHPGVYWSETQVRFLPPLTGSTYDESLRPPSTIVMLAGAVGDMVSPERGARLSSDSATLASQGIRHGFSVELPNTGGQWANQFVSPYLDVQVVGTTPDEVQNRMSALLVSINSALSTLEARSNVPPLYLVRTQNSPPGQPPLYYQKGSRVRASVGIALLGLVATALAITLVRRTMSRRSSAPA